MMKSVVWETRNGAVRGHLLGLRMRLALETEFSKVDST